MLVSIIFSVAIVGSVCIIVSSAVANQSLLAVRKHITTSVPVWDCHHREYSARYREICLGAWTSKPHFSALSTKLFLSSVILLTHHTDWKHPTTASLRKESTFNQPILLAFSSSTFYSFHLLKNVYMMQMTWHQHHQDLDKFTGEICMNAHHNCFNRFMHFYKLTLNKTDRK